MGLPITNCPEEQIKKLLNLVAQICLSEEFLFLKKELEIIYAHEELDNSKLHAFQDALYSFLSEEEAEKIVHLL